MPRRPKPTTASESLDSMHAIRPVAPIVHDEVYLFLCQEWKCSQEELPQNFWLGCIPNYISDGPGYHGPVYVCIWPASPNCVTILVRNEKGTLEMLFNKGI